MLNPSPNPMKLYAPYAIMLVLYAIFIICAFILETPASLFTGLFKIITSPSLLITDYIYVGGLGATLLNVSIVGVASVLMLMFSGIKPSGATIMAMWMTTGFAFFGKNVFNMIPLTCGVWIFSKYNKEPFKNYSLAAMLVATLSPVVSEISFLGMFSRPVEILIGILFGFLIGFIFPSISASSARVHLGYNLYNMGFAGGLLCVVMVPILNSFGLISTGNDYVSGGNNVMLAVGLNAIGMGLIFCGLLIGDAKKNLEAGMNIFKSSGRLVSDFYFENGNAAYLNMGILCIFSTTLVLILGSELNGPTIAAILTVTAFGSFGKHLRNVVPLIFGSAACVFINAYFNDWDAASPAAILAILFSTGLAPIAGQYGWKWGIPAGFLHVLVVMHIGEVSKGLNLYSNGFAAGFVAMFLLPIITSFEKEAIHK